MIFFDKNTGFRLNPCVALSGWVKVLVCGDRYAALPGSRVRGNTLAVLPLPICRPDGLVHNVEVDLSLCRPVGLEVCWCHLGGVTVTVMSPCRAGSQCRGGVIVMPPCRARGVLVTPWWCYPYRYVALTGWFTM